MALMHDHLVVSHLILKEKASTISSKLIALFSAETNVYYVRAFSFASAQSSTYEQSKVETLICNYNYNLVL